VTIPSTENFHY